MVARLVAIGRMGRVVHHHAGEALLTEMGVPALRIALPPLPFRNNDMPSSSSPMTAFIPAVGETAAPPPPSGGPGQWVPFTLALRAGARPTP